MSNSTIEDKVLQGALRDMDLREYEIQGHKFKQRKPCFDYRIRIEKKKFTERFNHHQNEFIKDGIKQIHNRIKNIGGVFEKLTTDDIVKLFDKDNDDSINKLDELKSENPELYFEFMSILTDVISKVYTGIELFVMDRNNLMELLEIMLEGDISAIDLNPETAEAQRELDETGMKLLNDFFLSKNQSKN